MKTKFMWNGKYGKVFDDKYTTIKGTIEGLEKVIIYGCGPGGTKAYQDISSGG